MFYLEFGIGQFSSCRPINAFSMVPILKGIGIGMGVISGLVTLYYNIIISYALIYLYESLRTQLPWEKCGNYWNSVNCMDRTHNIKVNISFLGIPTLDEINKNFLCLNKTTKNFLTERNLYSEANLEKFWSHFNCSTFKSVSPSEEFWTKYILQKTDSITDTGKFVPSLVIALAISWILLFLCLSKGIKSSGKVVYVTSLLPYVLITVMLIRGSILPGSQNGILYFIKPDWSRLKDGSVWIAAATQIFYSMGIGFGSLLLYASYNDFNNKFENDAVMCSLINCGTSIYAGFAVFAIIGHLSYKTGLPIDEVVTQGVGLIFVVYPEVLQTLPIAPLWSCLLFIMIATVGIDTQFGMYEACLSLIFDSFSFLKKWRVTTTFCCCFLWFLLGLPLTTQAGIYWVTLMDTRTAQLSLIIVAFLENITVFWIYGFKNFSEDIYMMTGKTTNCYWKYTWTITCPIVLIAIMIFSFISYAPLTYNNVLMAPFSELLGWGIFVASVICIPVYSAYLIIYKVVIQKKSFRSLFLPNSRYGPVNNENRDGYRYKLFGTSL